MMSAKKIIAVLSVFMILLVPAVSCVSSAEDDVSGTDVVMSRATVSYLKGVAYGEHMDRTDCWFFINDSDNEKVFLDYVNRVSDKVPTSDDKSKLNEDPAQKCNVYSIGLSAKFYFNEPLLKIDSIRINAKSGERVSVWMQADVGTGFHFMKTGSSDISGWSYGKTYITVADKDASYDVYPYNEGFNGGQIKISELFTKVTYDVKAYSQSTSNGNNTLFAVILFLAAAIIIAVIILSSRRISWAKGADKKIEMKEESNEEVKDETPPKDDPKP